MKRNIGLIITFSEKKVSKKEQQRILAEYVVTLMRWGIEAKKKKS